MLENYRKENLSFSESLVIDNLEASFRSAWVNVAFGSVVAKRHEVAALAGHPFYLRIQANRLRMFPVVERRDALHEAVLRFAKRLKRDPTLGLTEATQHLLPAYVSQHARSIASSLYRARSRRPPSVTLEEHPLAKEPSVADSTVALLIEDFRKLLREDEWFICLLRFRMDWKREDVAAALGVTVHRVRSAEACLRDRLINFSTLA